MAAARSDMSLVFLEIDFLFVKFFTGTTGYVKSFNYDSGSHLADQHYTACIRQELGYCSISWTSVTTTR